MPTPYCETDYCTHVNSCSKRLSFIVILGLGLDTFKCRALISELKRSNEYMRFQYNDDIPGGR